MKIFLKEIFRLIVAVTASFSLLVLIINLPFLISKGKATTPIPVDQNGKVEISSETKVYIPKLNIAAPIIFVDKVGEIESNLPNGTVHYPGTALPGKNGDALIVGHSSDYPWKQGNYKQVFVDINQLNIGDRFYIDYQDRRYSYRIIEKRIIKPDDKSILKTDYTQKTATLFTCYPPNTTLKRLIVKAQQE